MQRSGGQPATQSGAVEIFVYLECVWSVLGEPKMGFSTPKILLFLPFQNVEKTYFLFPISLEQYVPQPKVTFLVKYPFKEVKIFLREQMATFVNEPKEYINVKSCQICFPVNLDVPSRGVFYVIVRPFRQFFMDFSTTLIQSVFSSLNLLNLGM